MRNFFKYIKDTLEGNWYFIIMKEVTDHSSRAQILAAVYDSRDEDQRFPTKEKAIEAADLKIQELTRINGE